MEQSKPGEDQRKRLKAKLRVYYGPALERVLYSFSVDMSSGGLFLQTDEVFAVNDKVMLSFTLPDIDKIINCSAKVAWTNAKQSPKKPDLPPGIGLQFLDLSQDYLTSIQSLLRHDGVVPANDPDEQS